MFVVMNKILISIVVPVYEVEKYLSRCIDGILAQTFKNFELLLIDDGSQDRSGEICDKYREKDKRVKVYHTINRGVSSARNLGIHNSTGEYISFCDSDDFWEIDYLAHIQDGINKYPEAGLFSCGRYLINEDGGITKTVFFSEKESIQYYFIEDLCKEMNYVITSSITVSREVLRTVGCFRDSIARGEDLDLWLRISCKYPIVYINAPLIYYQTFRENNSSISAFKNIASIKKGFPYWEWYYYDYKFPGSIEKKVASLVLCRYVYNLLRLKEYKEAYKYFKRVRLNKYKVIYLFKILQQFCLK